MLPESLKSLAAELDAMGGRFAVDEAAPDFSGTDFRIKRLVGCGGMGSVYLAEQISLSRKVAVKVIDRVSEGGNFQDEAKTVARLHHPNIVHVYAAGQCGLRPYYAMEFIEGKTAAEHEFRSVEEVVRLGISIADALSYAHVCGIVHRDVKPSNILVSDVGEVKLGDFGLACMEGREDGTSGTRKYMPPERLRGESAAAQGDQYSLGVTLLELLARFPKWRRNRRLARILRKVTDVNPSARYTDMNAFAADLRKVVAPRPSRWIAWSVTAALIAAACAAFFAYSRHQERVEAENSRLEAEKSRLEAESAAAQSEAADRESERLRSAMGKILYRRHQGRMSRGGNIRARPSGDPSSGEARPSR